MASEAVKIAKIEKQAELQREIFALLKHPLYSIVGAFVLIETLEKVKVNGQPLLGNVVATSLQSVLGAGAVFESIGLGEILQGLVASKTGGLSNLLTSGKG